MLRPGDESTVLWGPEDVVVRVEVNQRRVVEKHILKEGSCETNKDNVIVFFSVC